MNTEKLNSITFTFKCSLRLLDESSKTVLYYSLLGRLYLMSTRNEIYLNIFFIDIQAIKGCHYSFCFLLAIKNKHTLLCFL